MEILHATLQKISNSECEPTRLVFVHELIWKKLIVESHSKEDAAY